MHKFINRTGKVENLDNFFPEQTRIYGRLGEKSLKLNTSKKLQIRL